VFLSALQIINSVCASDIEKEKYWKALISKNIKIGQSIDLQTDQDDFFSIYTKQNLLKEKGSVIILHDKGGHPDNKNVIRPLRIHLTDYGWNSLSIQMPLKKKKLKEKEEIEAFYEYGNLRLDSAISYLKDEKNQKNIFLIAYGINSLSALDYINKNPKRMVKGIVLIGMSAEKEDSINQLEKVKLPILDIFGSKDIDSVIATAPQRQSAAKRGGNNYYAQRQINYADHFFHTDSKKLIKRVHSWMVSTLNR